MTDARERRITALSTAAKAKSQAKTETTEQAIRRLVKRGEPITFQAVGREAGVSHAFLYGHPNLRGRIEHLRDQHRPMPAEPTPPARGTTLVSTFDQLDQPHQEATPATGPIAPDRTRTSPRREPRPPTRTRPTRLAWTTSTCGPRCIDRKDMTTCENTTTSRSNR